MLLALLLVLIVGSSYMLLKGLNAAMREARYQRQTSEVLARAKAALLGYAATYPDKINANFGPGYLPCPADDDSGMPRSACSPSTNSMLGRLPWVYLGMNDPRDASGAHLWYAVSDHFQYNPHTVPLNSETAGQLSVDGTGDIVAVVIAPGSAFDFQNRPSNNPADYLEQSNASSTAGAGGNGSFQSSASGLAGSFNDKIIAITRRELMTAVEKRVLGEVAQDLTAYRTAYGGFPWLSPYQNPLNSRFDAVAGTREGLLPVHQVAQPFATRFRFAWHVASGGHPVPDTTVTTGVLQDSNSANNNSPVLINQALAPSVTGGPECTWTSANDVTNCRGQGQTSVSTVLGPSTRTFQLDITYSGTPGITNPTASTLRTRSVSLSGAFPVSTNVNITITDHVDLLGLGLVYYDFIGTNTLDGSASGSLDTSGIAYKLDPAPPPPRSPELPPWFIDDNWHHLIYVAYAPGEPLPGGAAVCAPGVNCLSLQDNRASPGTTRNDVRALAVSAGAVLSGQNRAAGGGALNDYFEGQNASAGDGIFERRVPSSAFNDQIRVISTAP